MVLLVFLGCVVLARMTFTWLMGEEMILYKPLRAGCGCRVEIGLCKVLFIVGISQ